MMRKCVFGCLTVLMITGCLDHSTGTVSDPSPVADGDAQGALAAAPDAVNESVVRIAPYQHTRPDADGDGLFDDEDPDPNAGPRLPDQVSSLAVSALRTERGTVTLHDRVIPGAAVTLESEGVHQHGGPWWVRWHHADGMLIHPVTPGPDGKIRLRAPEVLPHAVSVIAGRYGSPGRPLTADPAGAPLIYPLDGDLISGSQVTLEGEHLDRIAQLWLGDHPLTPIAQTADRLVLALPEPTLSQRLHWQTDKGRHGETRLPIIRPVQVHADPALGEPERWQWLTDDTIYTLGEPATLWLPAGAPQLVRWTRNDRIHSVVSLVMPHETDVIVGAENMVRTWLWQYRRGYPGSDSVDFASILAPMADGLPTVVESLTRALNGQPEAYQEARQAFNATVPSFVWTTGSEAPMARWGILDYVRDTVDAVFAGGPLYEPIVDVTNRRARPGSATYANIGIGSILDLGSCASLASKPLDAWPSDLCVNNDSAVFISAKVVDWRSQEVLAGHIQNALDPNIIGGSGLGPLNLSNVAFLNRNNSALCKMRPCIVEVLTGGFGLFSTSSLSASEKEIADWLLARTFIDRVIFPIFEEITGLSESSDTLTCFGRKLLSPSPVESANYLLTISDFSQKVASAGSTEEVIAHSKDTIVAFVLDKLYGMATDKDLAPCLTNLAADTKNAVLGNVSTRLSDAASSAALPIKVAQIVSTIYEQWEVVSTPRKVVFDVTPRAAITEVTTSSAERRLFSESDSDFLRLYGTYLADPSSGGYFPDLVLTDRSGNSARMGITASQVFDASDMSWVDLRIRVDELEPLVAQLSGSRFDVALELDHMPFTDFPNAVLPLPAIHFDWVGDARLIGTNAGLIRAGDFGIVFGENLETYQRPDLQLVFTNAQSASFYQANNVVYRNPREIAFTLPDTMPSGQYEMSLIATGTQLPILDAQSPVEVISAGASFVRVLDNGSRKDDRMFVGLLGPNDEPLKVRNSSTLFVIPTQNTNAHDIWIGWEAGELQNSSGESRALAGIELECIDGKEDGVCTPRIVGEVVRADGSVARFDAQDTLAEGDLVIAR